MHVFNEKQKSFGVTLVDLNCRAEHKDSVSTQKARDGYELIVRTVDVASEWSGVDELVRCFIIDAHQISSLAALLTAEANSFSGLLLCEVKGSSTEALINPKQCSALEAIVDAFYIHSNHSYESSFFEQMLSDFFMRRSLIGIDYCHIRQFLENAGEVKIKSSQSIGKTRLDDVINSLSNELTRLDQIKRLFVSVETKALIPDELSLAAQLPFKTNQVEVVTSYYLNDKFDSDELLLTYHYSSKEKVTDTHNVDLKRSISEQRGALPAFKASRL